MFVTQQYYFSRITETHLYHYLIKILKCVALKIKQNVACVGSMLVSQSHTTYLFYPIDIDSCSFTAFFKNGHFLKSMLNCNIQYKGNIFVIPFNIYSPLFGAIHIHRT